VTLEAPHGGVREAPEQAVGRPHGVPLERKYALQRDHVGTVVASPERAFAERCGVRGTRGGKQRQEERDRKHAAGNHMPALRRLPRNYLPPRGRRRRAMIPR
jgi:hypothetical protein